MSEIDIDKVAEIHRQIDLVLLHDWNPIGVPDIPEVQDEYRNYVRGVYDIAVKTRSARMVAEHLVKMERDNMGLFVLGLRPWKKRVPIAEKILTLVSDVGPL